MDNKMVGLRVYSKGKKLAGQMVHEVAVLKVDK